MYIYGDQNVVVPENLSFSKFMLDRLRAVNGEEICLENGYTREKITYLEVRQYAVNLSVALSQLGVGRGDVVAVGSNPYLHFIPTALAVMFTGATYTGYDEDLESAFWIKHREQIKTIDYIKTCIGIDDMPELKLSIKSLLTTNEDVGSFEPVPVKEKTDTALIVYSSATTGMSKGIEISHYNCLSINFTHRFKYMPSLRTAFMVRPWSIYFYASTTFIFIAMGRKIVFANDLPIQTTLHIIRDCKVDAIFTSATFVREMAANSKPTDDYFDSVKLIDCASIPIRAETMKSFHKSFPTVKDIVQCFGSTETGEITTELWEEYYKPGSMGKVSPRAILKVVDLKTRALLGPNQHGEICVKAPSVMKGYINNINRANYTDEDGFFMTGDLGYYDQEFFFFFVSRIRDLILYKNFKIAPLDLETVLQQHPAVLDVGVIGRPAPHVHEVPMAFVVKKPGAEVSEKELIEFVDSQVTPYLQLRGGVRFIPEIPKMVSGKILYRVLRELLNKETSSVFTSSP